MISVLTPLGPIWCEGCVKRRKKPNECTSLTRVQKAPPQTRIACENLIMKRSMTISHQNRLQYQIGAKRFANLQESFYEILEILLPLVLQDGPIFASVLPLLVLVNKHSCLQVLNALRCVNCDTGLAFCRLTNVCECCAAKRPANPIVFWNHRTHKQSTGITLCTGCTESHVVQTERLYEPLVNGFRVRIDQTDRFDRRILQPTPYHARTNAHPMARELVRTMMDESQITLFLPPTENAKRPASGRLKVCDATSLVASFQPGLNQLDVEKRAKDVKFINDTTDDVCTLLESLGISSEFASPRYTPEDVQSAGFHGHWKTLHTEFASRLRYAIVVCDYSNRWSGFDDFINRLRREALHRSFGWIESTYGLEFDLVMCRRILNNGLRVKRLCTTTWKARRGGGGETQVVSLGVQLPCSKEQFLVSATPEDVDALGCCSVEGVWRTVSVGGLDTFRAIVTSAFVKEHFIYYQLNRSTLTRKRNLSCRCAHRAPNFKRSFQWVFLACSVCG